MQRACIIVPTYNESMNIIPLLRTIISITDRISSWSFDIVIVDDNSPDGTGEKVKAFQEKHTQVHIVQEKKQGLGVAYKRGFAYAVRHCAPDVLFEMDADMSHPPQLIPKFLEQIAQGKDFVIGSRYVSGGKTSEKSLIRKKLSVGGIWLAHRSETLREIHDCTSGYRCFKTNILSKTKVQKLKAKGYSFQIEFLQATLRSGAKVAEIPLVFKDRKHNKSKLRLFDMIEFFFVACRLSRQK